MNEKAVIRSGSLTVSRASRRGRTATWFVVPSGGSNPAADSVVGPATWPLRRCSASRSAPGSWCAQCASIPPCAASTQPAVPPADQQFDNRRAAIGIALLIVYVVAMPESASRWPP